MPTYLELFLDVLQLLVALGDLTGRGGRSAGELAVLLQHQSGDVLPNRELNEN